MTKYVVGALFLALASLAPFFFPLPFALLSAVIAALVVPPAAILTGALLDLLYYSHSGFPYFTIVGVIIAAIAFFVREFFKARIMS